MKQIPKTPVEFDYDLWTTEDGKCMVRVKNTGEVTEVDREVMKILRTEEKRLRRSYGFDNSSEDEDGVEYPSDAVLSLDACVFGCKVLVETVKRVNLNDVAAQYGTYGGKFLL